MFWFGGMWTLGLWVRKAMECFKYGIMGHTSRSVEDGGVEDDLNCGGPAQEVSEEKNFSMLLGDSSCDILVKNGCFLPLLKQKTCLRPN